MVHIVHVIEAKHSFLDLYEFVNLWRNLCIYIIANILLYPYYYNPKFCLH